MREIPSTITLDLVEQLFTEQADAIAKRNDVVGKAGCAGECPVARLLSRHYQTRISVSRNNTLIMVERSIDSGAWEAGESEKSLIPNDYGVLTLVDLVDDDGRGSPGTPIKSELFQLLLLKARAKLDKAPKIW